MFNREWDETTPANSEFASRGASRIRELKTSIRERLSVDHNFKNDEADDTDIGKHKKVTFVEQEEDVEADISGTILYDKSGKMYLRKKNGDIVELIDNTNQTIDGVKTFTEIPILPETEPTDDNQAVSKEYVDKAILEQGMPETLYAIGDTDVSTTSKSFVDMPDMYITRGVMSGLVTISFNALLQRSTQFPDVEVQLLVDDVVKNKLVFPYAGISFEQYILCHIDWVEELEEGSHSIKVQWKTSKGTLYNTGTSNKRTLIVSNANVPTILPS